MCLFGDCLVVQVIRGGVNLIEKVEQLDKQTAETKAQLEAAIKEQKDQQKRIDTLNDINLLAQQKYTSLEVQSLSPTPLPLPTSRKKQKSKEGS